MPHQQTLGDLIGAASVVLEAIAVDRDDAIRQAGEALVAAGAVGAEYVDGMLERERSVSTYLGEGVAVPHGTRAANDAVRADAIVVLVLADGVDWQGETAHVVIGLAARGMGHIGLLARLAGVLLDPLNAAALRAATSREEVVAVLDAPAAETPSPDDHQQST
jgi:PTS system mannitol-specific IIA component